MGTRWADYLDKRVLFGMSGYRPLPKEGIVQEVSPEESYVKISGIWYRDYDVVFLVVLGARGDA